MLRVEQAQRAPLVAAALLVGALAFLVGRWTSPPAQAKVVRAQRFELVDGGGRVRGTLARDAQHRVGLGILGDGSDYLVTGFVDAGGWPGMRLFDAQHEVASRVEVTNQAQPVISLVRAQ